MGFKEDTLTVRIVKGYSGQTRPMQVLGGPCIVCKAVVWIDRPKTNGQRFLGQMAVHYGCSR